MPLKDETGKRYGRLTALQYQGKRKWLCQCDCGNQTVANGTDLRLGRHLSCHRVSRTKSCIGPAYNFKDLTGLRCNNLTVIERQRAAPHANNSRWICLCDCGNETVRFGFELRNAKAKSCGCMRGKLSAPWLRPFRYAGAPKRGTSTVPTRSPAGVERLP